MKIKFIPKQALLICCVSILACNNQSETKVETEIPVATFSKEEVVANHLSIRDKIEQVTMVVHEEDSVFMNTLEPFLFEVDITQKEYGLEMAITREDSIFIVQSDRLYRNYTAGVGFAMLELHELAKNLDDQTYQHKSDSLKSIYRSEDSIATYYFNQSLDSSLTPLENIK